MKRTKGISKITFILVLLALLLIGGAIVAYEQYAQRKAKIDFIEKDLQVQEPEAPTPTAQEPMTLSRKEISITTTEYSIVHAKVYVDGNTTSVETAQLEIDCTSTTPEYFIDSKKNAGNILMYTLRLRAKESFTRDICTLALKDSVPIQSTDFLIRYE